MLDALVFVPDPRWQNLTGREIATAREELAPEGMEIRVLTAPPTAAFRDNTLYLTDNSAYYETMRAAGIPVIGYLHDGNEGTSFPHCPYLISEPQWVDVDSYNKIYERLTGLPWTILTTDRIVIREMTVQDLDALYDLYDAEARRFMTPPNEDRDMERVLLANYIDRIYGMFGYGYWAITLRDSGRMIGRMGFAPYEGAGERISFGYVIHKDYRRHGYALEAAQAILPYARDILQLEGISAEVHADNEPSIAFLQHLGFHRIESVGGMETYVYEEADVSTQPDRL